MPYGTRLGQLADELGDATAVTFVDVDGGEQAISWRQLDTRSTQLAHVFAQQGLGLGDRLAVSLPNSIEHLLAGFAGWKLGATVVPVRWDLPEWERNRLLEVLDPRLTIGTDQLDLIRGQHDRPGHPPARGRRHPGLGRVQLGLDRHPQGHPVRSCRPSSSTPPT